MRVIKENHGNVFPMEIECKHKSDENGLGYGNAVDYCHSILEIEAEDIKKHSWFKYPNMQGIDYGVICPICNSFITVDGNKIPKNVKSTAKEISVYDGIATESKSKEDNV